MFTIFNLNETGTIVASVAIWHKLSVATFGILVALTRSQLQWPIQNQSRSQEQRKQEHTRPS